MLVSFNWIKDFLALDENKSPDFLKLDPKELGRRLTMATAEVEEVLTSGEFLEKIKVVEIASLRKHPEADKLNLVTFHVGGGVTKEVVCGAPNVREGLKVPYAPLGVTLPNGMVLEPKKIRGVLSEGMLCSEVELGLGEGKSGLMELPAHASVGLSLNAFLNQIQDVIFNIDNKSLTHRPDLWGHYGFAREFATIFDCPLQNPFSAEWKENLWKHFTKETSPVVPVLKGESAGLAYYGFSVNGVEIGDSPEWMQVRLKAAGLRPINNMVDISNYVMLELGNPLHIFDRDLMEVGTSRQLEIRRLGNDEVFETLDGVKRELLSTDTVIADQKGPLVLAGIMGGARSAVNEKTKNLFVEVANWKANEVRRTSTRLGLRTDSSQRYEKTLDSQIGEKVALRTLELILQLCPEAKVVGQLEYDGENLSKKKPLRIGTSYSAISKKLGKDIPAQEIKRIFESLEFKVIERGGAISSLEVEVPSFRATKDIEFEADLVEEIGRMIGYDNITPKAPFAEIASLALSPVKKLHRKIQDFLTLKGNSFEVLTYPLVGEKLLEKSFWMNAGHSLQIQNPVSVDHSLMRPSLLPGLLEVIGLNQKNFDHFQFFEIGRAYLKDEKAFAKEQNHLAVVFFHKEESPFMSLVNTAEELLSYLQIPFELAKKNPKFKNEVLPADWKGVHPHEYLNIKIMGKFVGAIASLHPFVLREFKIKGEASVLVLDLSSFESKEWRPKFKYKPLPKFPSSLFDCTVVVGKDAEIESVLDSLKKVKLKELVSTKVVGIYPLNEEQKSVTLRATFFDPDKTLSGEFIEEAKNLVVSELAKAGFPLKQ